MKIPSGNTGIVPPWLQYPKPPTPPVFTLPVVKP